MGEPGTDRGEAAGIAPVIWMLPDKPARGPKPAHSTDEIAATAVAIADADGLDAVTMRRVAADVGCGTMTLYRYVPTKDHLVDLMIDAAEGELEVPAVPAGDWRGGLRAAAWLHRRMLLRHPWLTMVQSGRPSFGPNTLRNLEHGFGVIDNLGLDIDQMLVVLNTLIAYVRGAVIGELAEQEALRRTGLTGQQWRTWVSPYVARLVESGKFPIFNRIVADAKLPHSEGGLEEGFSLGLELLLDGLAAGLRLPDAEPGG